jgi:hypothetical protein
MVIMLDECTIEEQWSVVLFLWVKELNENDIHKEIFSVYGGKCLLHKVVHNWVKKFSQRRKSQMMSDQVRQWLRQLSKIFLC